MIFLFIFIKKKMIKIIVYCVKIKKKKKKIIENMKKKYKEYMMEWFGYKIDKNSQMIGNGNNNNNNNNNKEREKERKLKPSADLLHQIGISPLKLAQFI